MKLIKCFIGTILCAMIGLPVFGQVPDSTINVKAGKSFNIRLISNASTGYSWALSDSLNAGYLRMISASYQNKTVDPGITGAPGMQVFTLKALKSGVATIKLMYARQWEKQKPGVVRRKYFLVRIN